MAFLWIRFQLLRLIAKAFVVIVLLYGVSWAVGALGWHDLARQFGSAALYLLAILLTVLFIRWVWHSYTSPPRK